jgi:hypothetical protein
MNFFANIFRPKQRRNQLVRIQGDGTFAVEAVGESNYQRQLDRIAGGKTESGHNREVEAILIPDNANPHDRMAIAVSIDGEIVGYLDRRFARQHRDRMAEAGFPGSPAICQAMIVGGWKRRSGDEGFYGVRLDLPVT